MLFGLCRRPSTQVGTPCRGRPAAVLPKDSVRQLRSRTHEPDQGRQEALTGLLGIISYFHLHDHAVRCAELLLDDEYLRGDGFGQSWPNPTHIPIMTDITMYAARGRDFRVW